MIDITSIQTFYQELPRKTKVFANLKSFFVYVFCREVFSDAAVVRVAQLYFVVFVVKQVVYVHIVYVALNVFQVDVTLFVVRTSCNSIFVILVLFVFVLTLVFICLLQPLM